MRITVKKKEKKNYKSVKLVVFVLVFVLLVNTVPVKVSAAESKEDVYLMYYGNPDYCRLKGAKLPGRRCFAAVLPAQLRCAAGGQHPLLHPAH